MNTGSPTAEELAALCVVLAARAGSAVSTAEAARAVSVWNDPARRLGVTRDWRASALPR